MDFKGQPYAVTECTEYAELKGVYNTRIKDGQGRRHSLFCRAKIRAQIKPSATKEELIYNEVLDRMYLYENSDNVLDAKTLVKIAESALGAKYTINVKVPKYKINKEYCRANGISTKAMVGKARGEINMQRIGEVYDVTKSVKVNLSELEEMGVKVHINTLYNFCRMNNINPKGEGWKPKRARQTKIKIKDTITKQMKMEKETKIAVRLLMAKERVESERINVGNFTTTWNEIRTYQRPKSLLLYRHPQRSMTYSIAA